MMHCGLFSCNRLARNRLAASKRMNKLLTILDATSDSVSCTRNPANHPPVACDRVLSAFDRGPASAWILRSTERTAE